MNSICPYSIVYETVRRCSVHYYTLDSGCNVYCLGTVNYRCSEIGNKLCNTGYVVCEITITVIII